MSIEGEKIYVAVGVAIGITALVGGLVRALYSSIVALVKEKLDLMDKRITDNSDKIEKIKEGINKNCTENLLRIRDIREIESDILHIQDILEKKND